MPLKLVSVKNLKEHNFQVIKEASASIAFIISLFFLHLYNPL